jgi:hypothetical protein
LFRGAPPSPSRAVQQVACIVRLILFDNFAAALHGLLPAVA